MLTFANPLFLWGLLGLAAPVLIHLINRDLFRPLRFPSVRFIRRGKLPVERKRRLRDLLLLALRMLLFTAIVSALARPQWQPATPVAAGAEEETELVILLDSSASMSGWNAWDEAVAKARELLTQCAGSPAGLLISGAGPLAVEPLTTDHARLRALLNNAAPQQVAGDHRESFRQALRLFSGEARRRLAVISDFQHSDWAPASLPQAGADLQIDWLPVNGSSRDNAGILHARALPLANGRRQVVAQIRNFGARDTERTLLLRAGEEVLSRQLQLAPGQSQSVSFVLEEPSSSRAELSLDGDAYSADDTYFLWLGRPPALRVLVVAPTTDEPEKAEELFFVTRALGTRTEDQWLHFAINAVEPGQLSESALQNVRAVFLLGAAPYLDSSEWALLQQTLQQGGRLLFTPGKAPARQTALLADQELIDLSYEGIAGVDRRQPRPHSIDWVQPDSPIDLLFRDEAARTLSQVSIYQYARLRPRDPNGNVLLRTSNEDPLLVQREVGPGLVLATAFPFETSWTDLPVSTAFLPIIRELVAGDLPPDHGIVNIDTGTNASAIAARLDLPADAPAVANLDFLRPDIHVISNTPVILNAPRSESLPELASPVDLQAAVAPPAQTGGGNLPSPIDGWGNRPSVIPLWHWLALAGLFFFILEMPLAASIRRLRRREPASEAAVPAGTSPQST